MSRAEVTDPCRLLLGLIGTQWAEFDYHSLDRRGWEQIMAMAGQHRLLPLLHARIERGEISIPLPEDMARMLRVAHRDSAIMALAHRTEAFAISELLSSANIRSLVLKGGWLAWYAYPAAAERPVRDVDVLVEPGDALRAFRLLMGAGYLQTSPSAQPPEVLAETAKHMPPLTSPSGIEVEIHMHLWEPAGAIEWPMPPLRDQDVMNQARPAAPDDPCYYPQPTDMLEHLIIHAAYSHRFDVGPLLLRDIGWLIEYNPIGWDHIWRAAQERGWIRGAALVLALVDRWMVPGIFLTSQCPISPDCAVIDDCERLMLQDLDQKTNIGLAAGLLQSSSRMNVRRHIVSLVRRLSGQTRGTYLADGAKTESFGGWFIRRLKEAVRGLAMRETRQSARRKIRIGAYLSEA